MYVDEAFKEFLQRFFKRYGINPDVIYFDNVRYLDSMLRQLKSCNIDFSAIRQHLEVIFDLHEKGIYIYKADYKNSKAYSLEKDTGISTFESVRISTENYIERFLLTRNELLVVYYFEGESKYAMGYPRELNDDECSDKNLVDAIKKLMDSREDMEANYPKHKTSKFIKRIYRERDFKISRQKLFFDKQGIPDFRQSELYDRLGGLIERVKYKLKIDILSFSEEEFKAEICKIIYFFFELEHTPIIPKLQGKQSKRNEKNKNKNEPYFNAVDFLSHPSMENIGYSFFGRETYNGKITDLIKNKLEKEMHLKETSLEEIDDIKVSLDQVADTWDELLNKAHNAIDMGEKFDFDEGIRVLKSIVVRPHKVVSATWGDWPEWADVRRYTIKEEELSMFDRPEYQNSPITTLYLKVSQFERLGEVTDKMWVNSLKIEANYDVPQGMELLKDEPIGAGGVEEYIDKDFTEIAKFLYPELEPTENEWKSILANKVEVSKVLDCCVRAGSLINSETEITQLLVISCLQAILVDQDILTDKESDDGYTFYDYQHHLKTKRKLKSDEYTVEAIKFYWARKVEDHWYANIGKHDLCCKLREFESKLYEVLTKIYSCPNVSETLSWSEDYYDELQHISAAMFE